MSQILSAYPDVWEVQPEAIYNKANSQDESEEAYKYNSVILVYSSKI